MTITAPGLDTLARTAADAADALADLSGTDRAAATVLAGAVIPLTPRRTGRLAATVQPGVDSRGGFVLAGGSAAPYAPIVNAHTPFMARGVKAAEDQVTQLYLTAADDAASLLRGV